MQKYRSEAILYRYARTQPNVCCYNRMGGVKAIFNTQQEASRARKPGQGVYECQTHAGKWHIKTGRKKRRG